jgi:hypothetical protein
MQRINDLYSPEDLYHKERIHHLSPDANVSEGSSPLYLADHELVAK